MWLESVRIRLIGAFFCFCFYPSIPFACILYLKKIQNQKQTKSKICADDELANAITEAESKAPEDLTERDKIALLGRPRIGDINRAQLRIKESKEFKVYFKMHFVCSISLLKMLVCMMHSCGPFQQKCFIASQSN